MDALLLALTFMSLLSAGGFAAVAWRVMRAEQARSAARVAALSAAIDQGTGRSEARPVHGGTGAAVASLFDETAGRRPHLTGRPMLRVAVVVAMAAAIGTVAMVSRGGGDTRAAAAAPAATAPLELMSMRHARDGATLTVSGLVRNPAGGVETRRVSAVVFVFDRSGGFVASGRAPLDFVVLGPDDESPFTVTIPNVRDVARYRVSFRTEQGLVRHVDRRAGALQTAGLR